MGVSNLPRVIAKWCAGWESNPQPLDHETDTLTTTPPSHPLVWYTRKCTKDKMDTKL